MAKMKGLFKFEGKLDDKVGYVLNGKWTMRSKGKVDLHKMRTAPQYEETRKNQSEFAVASRAGQLFRKTLMDSTKGYTNYNYPPEVMSAMISTLRADNTQPKGFKQLNNGLKNSESQMAFRRLNIFSKKTKHYKEALIQHAAAPNAFRLNRALLWEKAKGGDKKTVRIGYLHLDFDAQIAHYEPALSISCTRSDKEQFTTHTLPMSNAEPTPWTMIIVQVWRESDIYEPTRLLFMSVLDVVDNTLEYEEVQETKRHFTIRRTKPTGIKITTTQPEQKVLSRNHHHPKPPNKRLVKVSDFDPHTTSPRILS